MRVLDVARELGGELLPRPRARPDRDGEVDRLEIEVVARVADGAQLGADCRVDAGPPADRRLPHAHGQVACEPARGDVTQAPEPLLLELLHEPRAAGEVAYVQVAVAGAAPVEERAHVRVPALPADGDRRHLAA